MCFFHFPRILFFAHWPEKFAQESVAIHFHCHCHRDLQWQCFLFLGLRWFLGGCSCCHLIGRDHAQPFGRPLASSLALGQGETPKMQGKLCLFLPITWQRIWKAVEAGNVGTKLPLWETWVPVTKHPCILTSRRGSWRMPVPAAVMNGQNSICPFTAHFSSL